MKKSALLKIVRDQIAAKRKNFWNSDAYEKVYICNYLRDAAYTVNGEPSFAKAIQNAEELKVWIHEAIRPGAVSALGTVNKGRWDLIDHYGVAGWLFAQGHITDYEMRENVCLEKFIDYRLAWLDDMIAYWKAKRQ